MYPLPAWTAFANDTLYSYSTLTFHNRTHSTHRSRHDAGGDMELTGAPLPPVTHKFLASRDNSVIDEITLYKSHKA